MLFSNAFSSLVSDVIQMLMAPAMHDAAMVMNMLYAECM